MSLRLLLLSAAVLFGLSAQAQFRYTFKDTTTPYVALTGATSVNGSTIWDEDDFNVSMPFSWKMDSSISMSSFPLMLSLPGLVDNPNNTSKLNGFFLGDFDIADRGYMNATSTMSPIRYTTVGTSPNRIFKLEIANGGFIDEYYYYNTMNDSFSVQFWIYETSNIVELHFGPSKISNASDYFYITGNGPVQGYLKNVDWDNGTSGKIYFLKGNPASPTLDSLSLAGAPPTNSMSAWPANGKVYRYTPKTTCSLPAASFNAVKVSSFVMTYTYTGTTVGVDSLVWDFGNGKKQTVTSNFTTAVSHTFTTKGIYNVTVTAYTKCGNTKSAAKTSAVSVGTIGTLANVVVFPNPATEVINIDGLKTATTATVISSVGQTVLRSELSAGKQSLSIASLPAGAYMLSLMDSEGNHGIIQFVKQ